MSRKMKRATERMVRDVRADLDMATRRCMLVTTACDRMVTEFSDVLDALNPDSDN